MYSTKEKSDLQKQHLETGHVRGGGGGFYWCHNKINLIPLLWSMDLMFHHHWLQFSVVLPLYSFSDDWLPLRYPLKPSDASKILRYPSPPRKN